MGKGLVRETTAPVYSFIDEHTEEPFFLWFAPSIPHAPHNAPSQFFELYQEEDLSPSRWGYFASVAWLDHAVGDLVHHLEKRGLLEKTLVVFVTDNGWQASDYDPENDPRGVTLEGSVLAATRMGLVDSPGGKRSVFEMGVRTPIIFYGPGVVPTGRVHDSLASAVDLVATILDYAGAPQPAAWRGRSLRPVIDAESTSVRDAVIGYMPITELDAWGGYFVRTRDWYFIQFGRRKSELYDMTADPEQIHDVADEHPALVQRFTEMIRTWSAENRGVSS